MCRSFQQGLVPMAEILLSPDEGESETLETVPYWSPCDPYEGESDDFSPSYFASNRHPFNLGTDEEEEEDPDLHPREACVFGSSTETVYYDGDEEDDDDQVSLVLNLFDRLAPRTQLDRRSGANTDFHSVNGSSLRVFDSSEDRGCSSSLDLGLELGVGYESVEDEFFVRESVPESGESSGGGLRVVGFESDSDEEDDPGAGINTNSERGGAESAGPADLGLPLCWDCLPLDDRLDERGEPNEDFEWEEVDDQVDEREVLTMVIDADEEGSDSQESDSDENSGRSMVGTITSLEWEVLLAVNNLDRTADVEEEPEVFFPDNGYDFVNATENEVLFDQFAEHENLHKGSAPTAESVLDNLPSVLMSEEDVKNNNTLCAICKDDISLEETAKKLPCSHHYHGDCIIPWLKMRSTCPVCRFELPTDDPDYESWKRQRAARQTSGDPFFMHVFRDLSLMGR